MIKKVFLICMITMLGLQGVAFAEDIKIGVVNLQKVLEKSEPGKKALEQLEGEYENMKAELDTRKQALDKMRSQIQQQSLALKQEAKSEKREKFNKKLQNFQSLYQRYQRKIRKKEQELKQPIIKKIVDIIDNFGKNNDFTIIMDKQNSGVVFNKKSLEITEKILSRLNENWEGSEKKSDTGN